MTRLFVYGTLTDPDVALAIIGRSHRQLKAGRATLGGYTASLVAGAPYPGLCEAPDGIVTGLLLNGLSPEEIRRLNVYEDLTIYRLIDVAVRDETGASVTAKLYMPKRGLRLSGQAWDLAVWQRKWKARYMVSLDRYR